MKNLGTVLKGFLGHHAGELGAVASVLDTLVGALPIQLEDKARIKTVTRTLREGAANIAASVKNVPLEPPVRIGKKALEEAVAAALPAVVAAELKRLGIGAADQEGTDN